ncbi:hypothetical protein OCS_00112 [Ophiocordyceps sinensis CO18]|uniref:Uncharacterized protein n=1 Tax=Ophiocordyceps sinensis (strain Co18 / CGMCC 3.14243) TaxID=911162 RepID=T5AQS0_OPHSC|nr:hypothetical protein OCS_00112 [Ophiocordyceps sinensis CO18]
MGVGRGRGSKGAIRNADQATSGPVGVGHSRLGPWEWDAAEALKERMAEIRVALNSDYHYFFVDLGSRRRHEQYADSAVGQAKGWSRAVRDLKLARQIAGSIA